MNTSFFLYTITQVNSSVDWGTSALAGEFSVRQMTESESGKSKLSMHYKRNEFLKYPINHVETSGSLASQMWIIIN